MYVQRDIFLVTTKLIIVSFAFQGCSRVAGCGCRVADVRLRVLGCGCRVAGVGSRGVGLRVSGCWVSGCRVSGRGVSGRRFSGRGPSGRGLPVPRLG